MFNRIFAAAAVGSMMIAAPAVAGDNEGKSITVSYDDLNLNTEAGQNALERRVVLAAQSVCNVNDIRTGTRTRPSSQRKCLAEAKANAKQQVAAIIEDARRGG